MDYLYLILPIALPIFCFAIGFIICPIIELIGGKIEQEKVNIKKL